MAELKTKQRAKERCRIKAGEVSLGSRRIRLPLRCRTARRKIERAGPWIAWHGGFHGDHARSERALLALVGIVLAACRRLKILQLPITVSIRVAVRSHRHFALSFRP